LCYDDLVVELKAVETTAQAHRAQVISYLTATRNDVGLLLNFGRETLKEGITGVVDSRN
jgi:GxxExxY protein